jgi:predicted amidohydrolase YtcJ
MISDNKEDLDYFFAKGRIKSARLNVRSVKVYADGALGSRGACLLKPNTDKPEEWGFLLNNFAHFDSLAEACYKNGFQMNTHCIGDSANRYLTDVYSKYLGGTNDLRWRIEHAQIVSDTDINKFSDFSIIPSVQPTHATSDMYWAEDRLGKDRMHEAYRYQTLLEANGLIALGTDFPVEDIDPLLTFYAAVVRKDLDGYPEKAFIPKQRLTRKEALMGMTIWAAIANFEEMEKGSLETNKFADFVILDSDIMKISELKIPEVNVIATYIGGEEVYRR